MRFKDRADAGRQLSQRLEKDDQIITEKDRLAVVSLLRGGAMVGKEIARQLEVPHYLLAVAKVSHPDNEELAIGALCGDFFHLDDQFIERLQIDEIKLKNQLEKAKKKLSVYRREFALTEFNVRDKTVLLVDDGVATGASVGAARLFLQNQGARQIILVVPVAPEEFAPQGFDRVVILRKSRDFRSVSQFYEEFPQIDDEAVLKTAGSS